ncbi:hypothetical protein TNCV_2767081 [Trichonephila clavipes]|nr:hypothetical protein TNCV_2767081 [Trichonephila clavipes]
MIVQFRNEKVSNHGSIPITIDCNVVAFIVFEEGFHQPIKRTKQSVFLDFALEKFASDPECVVNNSSEIQFASFRNFVVIHSISGRRHRKSANRHFIFKERPASDPKCVVILQPSPWIFGCKMAFLLSKKKEHLIELAEELGLIVEASLTKPKLKDLIVKAPDYIEDDVKVMIDSIVKDRIRTEEEKLGDENSENMKRNCDENSENMKRNW